MSDVVKQGGVVFPSSQQTFPDSEVGEGQSFMLGVIIEVNPSDHKDNMVAKSDQKNRGSHHECTVLAGNDLYSPDIFFHHVIIPPMRHSGMDNFEEDLPRGCSQLIDGSTWNKDLRGIDYGKLDGEWCILGFLNGSQSHPFIVAWWPHPSNRIDSATSGNAYDQKALVQADTKKNRFRSLRVVNGTLTLTNREGSVYLDTTQAGRNVNIKDGKHTVTKYEKGGHIQVDVKKSAQLEINFNEKAEKGPRIGAGSTATPVHDQDLPHPDQPIVGTVPETRSTKRTYRRSTEWAITEKTSSYQLTCENTEGDGGEKGEATLQAADKVIIQSNTEDIEIKSGTLKKVVISDLAEVCGNTDAMLLGTIVHSAFTAYTLAVTTAATAASKVVPPTPVSNMAFITALGVANTALAGTLAKWLSLKAKVG